MAFRYRLSFVLPQKQQTEGLTPEKEQNRRPFFIPAEDNRGAPGLPYR